MKTPVMVEDTKIGIFRVIDGDGKERCRSLDESDANAIRDALNAYTPVVEIMKRANEIAMNGGRDE